MKKASNMFDIVIIGGGPAGLAFSLSLAQMDLRVCVLEKERAAILENPPSDGREIAHTHASIDTLKALGVLSHVPKREIIPIGEAKVLDGSSSTYFLNFKPGGVKRDALGYIISNNLVRKAAYAEVKKHKNITLIAGAEVQSVRTDEVRGEVTLSDGRRFEAPLVVAADGRFSPSRRRMGIPVTMRDFGRTIIVARLEHEKPHGGIAYECFNYERTLAMLPLAGRVSSAVITLPTPEVDAVMSQSPAAFSKDVEARFEGRLGRMKLQGKRHAYPLVGVYANRFVVQRFALLGDAAVGMHPVTAHGFNFGLKGQAVLAEQIREALAVGLDIGSPSVLDAYNRRHRAATLPLYHGTNTLVGLFTDEHSGAKIMRRMMLHLGNNVRPFKSFVTRYLADAKSA